MARAALLALVVTVLGGCGGAPRAGPGGAAASSRSIAPLPIPAGPGNGPAIKAAACPGNNAACAQINTLENASALLGSWNVLAPPAAPFTALTVPSWSLAQPIDWSSGASNGTFGVNLATGKLFPSAATNWGVLFAGWLKVPASATGQPVVKTFAVASDDGVRFAISDGSAIQSTECNIGRSMGVGCTTVAPPGFHNTVVKVTFPGGGGLFPFDLLWFQARGAAGLELSWADGDQTGSPPGASAGPFALVPPEAIYSPEVRATLTAQADTATVAAGSALTYSVQLANRGAAALSTWTFSALLPAVLGPPAPVSFPGSCSVSGQLLACTGAQALQPGDAVTGSFTAKVAADAAAGAAIDVQGVITGLATAPELAAAVGGASESAAGELYALTDDPYAGGGAAGFDLADTGNAPAGLASTTAAGNADDDPTRLVVGKPPPAPPQPTGPPDGSHSDRTWAVSGTSGLPQGTAIQVTVTGPTAGAGCATAAGASGAWSCPGTALADGAYAATALVVDAAGSRGPPSPVYAFTIAPPPAPSIDTPAGGSTVTSALVLFRGASGEPDGQRVRVTALQAGGAPQSCEGLVGGGTWSCTLVLADGAWTASAAVVEATGALGASSATGFTVTTGSACGAGFDATPSPTNQTRPPLSGNAAAGSQVTVCEGAALCGTGATVICTVAQVPASGSWACTPQAALADGVHSLLAVAKNPGTGQLCASNSDVFTVDTVPPPAPGFDQPASPSPTRTPVFTGSGQPGLRVEVSDGAGGLLCGGAVDTSSRWSCTSSPLADGSYALAAVQVDLAQNRSPAATRPLVVDAQFPAAPTLDQPASPRALPVVPFTGTTDQGTTVRVVDSSGAVLCTSGAAGSAQLFSCSSLPLADGAYTVAAIARSPSGRDSPPSPQRTVVVDTVAPAPPVLDPIPSPTSQRQPAFSGTAEAGAAVRIVDLTPPGPTSTLCAATSGGTFSCAASAPLALGTHTVQAVATDAAGNLSSPSAPRSFVIDASSVPPPTLDPLPAPAGGVAGFTAETRPALGGQGVAGDAVTARVVGGPDLCAATVAAGGSWSCRPASDLTGQPATQYPVEAVQAAPGTPVLSAPSAPISFTVDTHTPAAPLLDRPATPTAERTPLLSGTAEPLVSVAVTAAPLGVVCSAAASAQGAYACRPAAPLADGDYQLTSRATSRAGVVGPASAPARPLTVAQPVVLQAPSIDPPRSPTRDRQPLLQGAAGAGASVTVRDAGGDLCTGTVSAGRWSCAPAAPLADGTHALVARAGDLAGHVSPDSAAVSLVVRATPPDAPVIDAPAASAELLAGASGSAEVAFAGSAEPGAAVTVVIAPSGPAVPAAVAGAGGRWALAAPVLLGPGSFTATATARVSPSADYALESPPSAVIAFAVRAEGAVRGGCSGGPAASTALLGLLALARRRRRRAPAASRAALLGALLGALLLPAGAAQAQQQVDLGRFRPASGGDGLAATEGARPPLAGEAPFSLGLWLDGAWQPLVFVPAAGGREVLVSSRVTGVLAAQAHVWSALSVAVQLPVLLGQGGDLSSLPSGARPVAAPGGGVGDLRVTPRLGLLRQEDAPLDLAVQLGLTLPTASDAALAGDGSAQAEALLAAGRRLALLGAWDVDLLGNALLRVRRAGRIGDVNTGSELGLRGGAAWIPPGAPAGLLRRVFLEAEAAGTLRSGFSAGSLPAEWRAGASLCAGPVALELAGGTALGSGVGAPRARFVFGLELAPASCAAPERLRFLARGGPPAAPAAGPPPPPPGPPAPEPPTVYIAAAPEMDSDGDGIPDSQDACPLLPGPASLHGCPEVKPVGGDLPLEAILAPAPPAPAPAPAASASPGAAAPSASGAASAPTAPAGAPPPAAAAAAGAAPEAAASGAGAAAALALATVGPAAPPAPVDTDGDGVPDDEDSCPATAGVAANHGCPAETPQAVALHGERIELSPGPGFAEGTSRLDIRSLPPLAQLAAVLRAHPELARVEVQGHVDNRLPAEKARALSRARAEAVLKQLVRDGVEPARLSAKGYGAERPIAPNLGKLGRQRNQRIELRVLEWRARPAPGKAVGG